MPSGSDGVHVDGAGLQVAVCARVLLRGELFMDSYGRAVFLCNAMNGLVDCRRLGGSLDDAGSWELGRL